MTFSLNQAFLPPAIAGIAAISLFNAPSAAQQPAEPSLASQWLYNGVNRPVIIEVASPHTFGSVTLVLMDADGKPLAEPIDVRPGRIDLAEKLPAIWTIRKTAYLQMIEGESASASALVLQPMLSRLAPVMEAAKRPNGASYMRIAKWVDENQPAPPPSAVPPTPPATAPANEGQNSAGGAQAPAAAAASEAKPVERLFTGLRIYPEQDVVLHTTQGDIRIALRPDEAPNTAWNFLELAKGGFFRDIQFHRIVPMTAQGLPFVIQAGDPTATGDGGPGYWLPIEDSHLPHDFGVISMARSDDPDSAGSQIFLCLSREGTARLDGQYCAFGYAVDGGGVIKAIAKVPLADVEAGRAAEPPLIKTAEAVAAPARQPGKGRPDARAQPDAPPAENRSGRVPR